MRVILAALVAATSFAAVEAQAATELRIGTAATTKSEVSGTLAGTRRLLKLGDGVFQNEDIATGDAASAQILFTDETALTMGPNSRVILDKLVYDPSQKKGELAIRATTGAFRFISGSGPKAGYKIETPMGTIGVRGTIIELLIRGPQLTLSLTEGGTYLCTKTNKCVELTQPGTYVVINASQIGETKSKNEKACEAGKAGGCSLGTGDDTLFLEFIGLRSIFNNTGGPGTTTPDNPGPPNPPPPGGFSPIINPGIGTPPGLNSGALPPGLQDRCAGGSCVKPGPLTAPGRNR